jgi:5-methyltetrahydrofolate--homocysteine methyltransferase
VYGIFPAVSLGNDVLIEDRKFHFLRQQRLGSNICMADFVDQKDDYIGVFAATAGKGSAAMIREYRDAGDDYSSMMIAMLSNRIAEALAEYTHHQMRLKWGFDRDLTPADMLKQSYAGIRPAVGYPSWPDHSELATLFAILDVEKQIDIQYTESFMMIPESSTCGIVLAHPEARYFEVGKISQEQLDEYAARKGVSVEESKEMLSRNLL